MKAIIVVLTILCCLHGIKSQLVITGEHLNPEHLTEIFAKSLIRRIGEKRQAQIVEQGARGPILFPPELELEDPLPLQDQLIDFDSALLMGSYGYILTSLQGLSTLKDDLIVKLQTPLIINYTLSFEELAVRGNYSLDIGLNLTRLIELIPDLPIEEGILPLDGSGAYELGVNKFELNVGLVISVTNGSIDQAMTSLDLQFDSLLLYFEKLRMSGTEIEEALGPDIWNFIRGLLKGAIDSFWSDNVLLLEGFIDNILEGCPVIELISGDLSCTGLFPPPGTEPPATEPPAITTQPTPQTEVPTTDGPDPETTTQGAAHFTLSAQLFILSFMYAILNY